ncbi:MAG: dethiobiotin synthase [Magnetococcales bacterium]|nr:dethiobiotin synthase [Magnetococcales bacterium]
MNIKRGVFVTGSDTGVGKSVAAAWLVGLLAGAYWKPVQSGLEGESDTGMVRRLTGCVTFPETFRLTHPLSPHEAARLDGLELRLEDFSLPATPHPLIVEGAGGVLVPLNGEAFMVDLMARLGLPVVLTARTALGTINHTLMSLECLRRRDLAVAGVILSGPPDPANREAIARFGAVPIIAEIPWLAPLTSATLAAVPCRHRFLP